MGCTAAKQAAESYTVAGQVAVVTALSTVAIGRNWRIKDREG